MHPRSNSYVFLASNPNTNQTAGGARAQETFGLTIPDVSLVELLHDLAVAQAFQDLRTFF